MNTSTVATGIPIAEYQSGEYVGVECKYCTEPATTVYTAGHGAAHESMAFCDDCKPGSGAMEHVHIIPNDGGGHRAKTCYVDHGDGTPVAALMSPVAGVVERVNALTSRKRDHFNDMMLGWMTGSVEDCIRLGQWLDNLERS